MSIIEGCLWVALFFVDYVKDACYDLFCSMHVVRIAPLLPRCLGIYMYFRYFLSNCLTRIQPPFEVVYIIIRL